MTKGTVGLSKEGLRFVNRVEYFGEDIEFVELLYRSREKVLPSSSDDQLFLGISSEEPMLKRKQVCTQSRTIVIGHIRSTVYTAFFKEIYEEFTEYLQSLIVGAALLSKTKDQAYKLIGNAQINISGPELLQVQDIQDLHRKIAMDVMRQLENERSTIKLIEKICSRLSISIEKRIIDEALPYLELRHILVHADGKADKQFKGKYKGVFQYRVGNYVKLNKKLADEAKEKITTLVKAIDMDVVARGILKQNNAH